MAKVLIGTDPEFFLSLGGRIITAAGLFPGTKAEPFQLEKGALQVDGNALEFNIHAAKNEDEFNNNINIVMNQIRDMANQIDKDIKFEFQPIANFSKEVWENVPLEAKELGCDPDFNIEGEVNPNPTEIIGNLPVRTAAGHLHIGWTKDQEKGDPDHFNDCKFVASGFYKKGVFAPVTLAERERLKYYGANGAFRPKAYGVELRSPSNLWVANEELRRETYRKTMATFNELTGL